jgi:hypothetical protein
MEDSPMQTGSPVVKFIAPLIAAVAVAGAGVGYAVHEHHAAEQLAAQNRQVTAQLSSTQSQLNQLTAKVSELSMRSEAQAATPAATPAAAGTPASTPAVVTGARAAGKPRASRADRRLSKMQAQLDAQGKEIEDTRGDLTDTRTELTGTIAKTHDELVVLEKRGERSYFEFDLQRSKQFTHEGPVGVSLRKANLKHHYADLELMVDDRDLVQKHVNLDQPVMFYQPDTEQPIQLVINDITKDHIHGYVSAPKYRKSELASMSNASANPASGTDQGQAATADAQIAARKKLTVPQ